jgi:hypothetical protein
MDGQTGLRSQAIEANAVVDAPATEFDASADVPQLCTYANAVGPDCPLLADTGHNDR